MKPHGATNLGESLKPVSAADPDSEIPEKADAERIGRYQLCFELASGGMATVYLARQDGLPGFEKLVALKKIHPHLAKERDYVEMFLDEARIASRITHSNVCSVFDFGEAEGEYFISMEFLVGEPLSRVYRRVAASPEHRTSPKLPMLMARVIADACEGLHAAHELKDANGDLLHVVHRDVSARNLFVTYAGVVQVVDFGIASARQRVHHTSTGQVKGTFPYMAPEQMTAGSMDRRVDIWALGVVLWELLTLRRLFRRDTDVNTMYAVLSDEIRPPSHYRPDVPKDLDAIVARALQRNPEERFQTAREMGQALTQFLAKQREAMGPVELSEWMAELFAQGEARKRQLMEIARISNTSVPALPKSPDDSTGGMSATLEPGDLARRPNVPHPIRTGVITLITGAMCMLGVVGLTGATRTKPEAPIAPAAQVMRVPAQPPAAVQPKPRAEKAPDQEMALDFVLPPEPEPQPTKPVVRRKPRPKPAPKADPVPSGPPGIINLVTRGGWAHIYQNGKRIGTTPRKLKLPSGKHSLKLKPFGEGPFQTVDVKVEPGKTKKVSIRLTQSGD